MTASYLQVAHDRVTSNPEVSGEFPHRPSLLMKLSQIRMILLCQLRQRTSSHVHRSGHWFYVFWIYAKTNAAKMICLKAIWPWADSFFPHGPMGNGLSAPMNHLPIAAYSNSRALPNPTWAAESAVLNEEEAFIDQSLSTSPRLTAIQNTCMTTNESPRMSFDVAVFPVSTRRDRRSSPAAAFAKTQCHIDASYQDEVCSITPIREECQCL